MIALDDCQSYLQEICCRYQQWWTENALTEVIAAQQATFSFEQMVQTEEKDSEGKPKRITLPIFNAIENYIKSEHILLVGSPGVGKSTALLRCLVQLAEREREKPEPRIPVLISLKRYNNNRFSCPEDPSGILALIKDTLEPDLWLEVSDVKKLLFKDKQLILLLDGLNEMSAGEKRTELEEFRKKCDRSKVPLICTTRELGGGDLGIKRKLEIQPLRSEEVERFLQDCLPELKQKVLQLLNRDNRELSRTPFVLWMLYDLFQEQGVEVETLAKAFRQFFQSFKKYKGDMPVTDERRQEWNRWLEHLAFTMLNHLEPTDPGLVISKEQAEKSLIEKFGSLYGASSRIEELLKYHLLETISEKEISFHHQLIQEYYAAEYLLTQLPDLLKKQPEQKYTPFQMNYLNYVKWTEAIALMLGLLEEEDKTKKILELSSDIDWQLKAKFIGASKGEIQKQTVSLLTRSNIPQSTKVALLGKTRSNYAVLFLDDLLQASSSKWYGISAEALGEIGSEEAIAFLRKALTTKNLELCTAAIWALGRNGSQSAVDVLYHALNRREFQIRFNITEALGEITDEVSLPALAKALKDKNPDVRISAAGSIGGVHSDRAVAILEKALGNEKNSEVRWWIIEALGEIGIDSAVSVLTQVMLRHSNSEIRQNAVNALGETGNDLAIPVLADALKKHKDFEVRLSAIDALGEIGSETAIHILYQTLDHSNPDVRHRAIDTLALTASEFSREALMKALTKSESYIRCAAIDALGKFGYIPAYPALRDMLMHEDSSVRISATTALRKMGIDVIAEAFSYVLDCSGSFQVDLLNAAILGLIDSQEAINKFISGLNHESPYVRSATAYMLGEIGDQKTIPYLLQALEDEDPYVRASAIDALISLEYEYVLFILEQALEDEDSYVRSCVIDTLKEIGCRSAIAILIQALEDENLDYDAAEALKEIGGEQTMQLLIPALEHSDQSVRWVASDVAAVIGESQFLPYLEALFKNGNVEVLSAIAAIQSHCGFYNYAIYQQAQEAESLGVKGSFISNLYKDIDRVISQIQENPELRQTDNEDRLTVDIRDQLRSLGYNAEHDPKIGGHVDLIVRKDNLLWLGEAKIYRGDNYLWEGFQQLTTRYSTGDSNQNSGGLLIYIFDGDAQSIMEKWQTYLLNKNLPNYSCKSCEPRSLAFISSHRHERSGQPFHVKHIPVLLHFDPKDKSGRKRKKSS